MEQDRIETVLSVVDNYTREIERYRNELKTVTKQITDMGNTSGGATSGVQKLMASLGGVKGILAGLGIAVGIKEIAKLGMSCINAASEIKELNNVLDQIFEKGSKDVAEWAKAISTNVGRATFDLQQQAAIFGSIFKASGIKTEDLQGMSMALSQLAADFSSFYDNNMEEVFTALKSAVTGQAVPLMRYGIVLNETTAAEYALSQGIKTKWQEMSEAQKQIIRYNFLMEKTKFVQGDAERTIDSYANQLKVLGAYWDSISRTLGQKFIPAGEDALHVINSLMGTIDGWLNKPTTTGGYIGEFLGEASEIQNLAAEYEALSKKASLTNDEEARRVQIFSELQSKYPDILSGISGEKSAYKDVITALDDVIERLKEKIKLQILEGFSDEMAKEVEKFTNKINKAMETANNIKVKIATDFNIDADKFVTPEMVENLKKSMDKGMAERTVATLKMTGEFEALLIQQGINDKNATYIARMLTDYAANQVGIMQKQEQGYTKLENDLTKIAQKRDNTIEIFDKFTSNIEAGNNQILQGIFSTKQDIKNNTNNIISNSKIAQLESDKYIAGVVRDSKGDIVGRIDGTKEALSSEAVRHYLETNDHITIIGSELRTEIVKGNNGMYKIIQKSMQNGVVVNESGDKNAEEVMKTIRGMSKGVNEAPNPNGYAGSTKDKKGSKEKKPEKDKWEQMLESLTKQINEFSIKNQELAGKIKNTRSELEKLEWDKVLDFSKALDLTQAEVIQSLIKIKETSRDLARTLDDKSAVEKYTQEIKKLNEQLYYANTGKEYKKKTEELTYNIKSDNNKEVYKELIQNIEGYITASKADLDKRYSEGLDDYATYLDKQAKLYEGIEDTYDKLGLSNEKLNAAIEKNTIQTTKNAEELNRALYVIKRSGELSGAQESETGKKEVDVLNKNIEKLSDEIANLEYENSKLGEKLDKLISDNGLSKNDFGVPEKAIAEVTEEVLNLEYEKVALSKKEVELKKERLKASEYNISEYDKMIRLYESSKQSEKDKKEYKTQYEKIKVWREQELKIQEDIKKELESGFKNITLQGAIKPESESEILVHDLSSGKLIPSILNEQKKGNVISEEIVSEVKKGTEDRLDLNKSLSQTDYDFLNKYNENLKSQSSDSFKKYKVDFNQFKTFGELYDFLLKKVEETEKLYSNHEKSTVNSEKNGELSSAMRVKHNESLLKIGKSFFGIAENVEEIANVTSETVSSTGNAVDQAKNLQNKILKNNNDLSEKQKELSEAKTQVPSKEEANRVSLLGETFEKGIEDLFLNINPQGIQESLISGVKDLFDKAVQGTDIGGIYNKKYSEVFGNAFREAMEGYTSSGDYRKDQIEQEKILIESLKVLAASSDAAVRSIANLTLFDTVKTKRIIRGKDTSPF